MACPFKRCQVEVTHCDGACHGVMPDGSPIAGTPETVNKVQEDQSASAELLPHQQRVVDEKNDLYSKLQRLTIFIEENPQFHKLSGPEQVLLTDQCHIMKDFLGILCQRIALFKPE